ncbi:thioredoxin-like protein [Ochromonadaceae sp. CCMP2298]|nr:thioredoxin-like protein [Ochromonadaceae sp. CCMP2298]
MAVLCICGICIPYSVVWPFVLLLLKQLYSFFFPAKANGEAKVTDASGKAVEVNEVSSFVPIAYNDQMHWDEVVGRSKTVILRFTAGWCKPCKAVDPLFQQLCADHHESATFYNVDVDEFGEVAAHNGAVAIPMFVAYRAGQKLGSLQSKDEEKLTAFVKEHASA